MWYFKKNKSFLNFNLKRVGKIGQISIFYALNVLKCHYFSQNDTSFVSLGSPVKKCNRIFKNVVHEVYKNYKKKG